MLRLNGATGLVCREIKILSRDKIPFPFTKITHNRFRSFRSDSSWDLFARERRKKVKFADIGEREINNEFPEGWCPRGKYENSFHSRNAVGSLVGN